ncbi:MAG: type IV pilus modification protein PilV [Oleiphilus sp.]|nr:MAG: type IV pilus modification protein PilV [Oleiphilus sp.]
MFVNTSTRQSRRVAVPMAHRQAGFSMIEVLVTILIFAIGLLGVASLQTTGMRMVRDGGQLGQAAMLAASMADKMRSNAAGDTYVDVDGGARECENADLDADPPEEGCSVAQEDIFDWNDEIEDFLPGGSGTVTVEDGAYVISVSWQESDDSNQADNTRTYTLPVVL